MDRIEKQLLGRASVIRVNVATATGIDVARKYDIRATPTTLVIDGEGNVVYTHVGVPSAGAISQAVENAR